MTQTQDQERLLSWARSLAISCPDADVFQPKSSSSVYEELRCECFNFLIDNTNLDLNQFNPLSKVTAGNPWAKQYDNQNKLSEIKLDVDRTYQEMDFFSKNNDNHKALINVLFTFTKTHKLDYRQGMNEICAIFFLVVTRGLPESASLDQKESVTYEMFSAFMMRFGYADMFYQSSVLGHPIVDSANPTSPLLSRCEKVFELLHVKDSRLHKHLVTHDISPNLFLVRWIRIMFAREFPFNQTLDVWDFIFSHLPVGKPLPYPSIIDYLAIAMIINIRIELLQSDNSGCFSRLLKYPKLSSVNALLDLAIQVRDNGDLPKPAPVIQPAVVNQPMVVTRRDKIIGDLTGVVADLKNSECNKQISLSISKLEEIITFIKK
jgi:TBC1 domain family protein 5